MSLFTTVAPVRNPLQVLPKYPIILEIRIGGIICKGRILLIATCEKRVLKVQLEITHKLSNEKFVPIDDRWATRKVTVFRSLRKTAFLRSVDRSMLFVRSDFGRRNITLATSQ